MIFKYKIGVMELNPNNLMEAENFDDAEGLAIYSLTQIKDEEEVKSKCSLLDLLMRLTIGNWITMESFIEILDYIGLDYVIFEDYVKTEEKLRPRLNFEREWFYKLNRPFIKYGNTNRELDNGIK